MSVAHLCFPEILINSERTGRMQLTKNVTCLWAAIELELKQSYYPRMLLEIRKKYVFQKLIFIM
jgi:hypothetical protein